jgi:hypothetical protein
VSANIWFENGECLEGVSLEGDASYASSIGGLEQQHKSRVSRVIFNDSAEEESEATATADTSFTTDTTTTRGLLEFASSRWDSLPSVSAMCQDTNTSSLLTEIKLETVLQRYTNLIPLSSMERSSLAEVKESMRQNYKGKSSSEQRSSRPAAMLGFGRSVEGTAPAVDQDIVKHQALQVTYRCTLLPYMYMWLLHP